MSTAAIAAPIIGGIVSGVGSGIAGSQASSAANKAAQLQEQQYQQTRQDQAPYMAAGTTALGTIQSDQANGTGFAAPFNFQADPGYQFNLQQGTDAINNSAAAKGGVLNGGTLKALSQYTSGLADTTYNSAYNRYLQGSNQSYNQLMGVAGLGESATANTGAAGANAANAAGSYTNQAGQDTAAGTVGIGTGINQGLSGASSAGQTYSILNQLQQAGSASSYGRPINSGDASNLIPTGY